MDLGEDESDTDKERRTRYACQRCGEERATVEDLIFHRTTHNIYACSICKQMFSSNLDKNKHQTVCHTTGPSGIYEANATDNTVVQLGHTLLTISEKVDLSPEEKELLRDQVHKSITMEKQKTVTQQSHKKQTHTYVKVPTFNPNNTKTGYSLKDTEELKQNSFNGKGEVWENYTSLQSLVEAIDRLRIRANITENTATSLLIQHTESPVKDHLHATIEDMRTKYGPQFMPALSDIILEIEKLFVPIRPQHANEQLATLQRDKGESPDQFFLRAWRCSYFASYITEAEARNKFRHDAVRETILRNLEMEDRQEIDAEELRRKLHNEPEFNPREMVEFLSNRKAYKRTNDIGCYRPDFTSIGLSWTNNETLQIKKGNVVEHEHYTAKKARMAMREHHGTATCLKCPEKHDTQTCPYYETATEKPCPRCHQNGSEYFHYGILCQHSGCIKEEGNDFEDGEYEKKEDHVDEIECEQEDGRSDQSQDDATSDEGTESGMDDGSQSEEEEIWDEGDYNEDGGREEEGEPDHDRAQDETGDYATEDEYDYEDTNIDRVESYPEEEEWTDKEEEEEGEQVDNETDNGPQSERDDGGQEEEEEYDVDENEVITDDQDTGADTDQDSPNEEEHNVDQVQEVEYDSPPQQRETEAPCLKCQDDHATISCPHFKVLTTKCCPLCGPDFYHLGIACHSKRTGPIRAPYGPAPYCQKCGGPHEASMCKMYLIEARHPCQVCHRGLYHLERGCNS